MQKVDPNFTMPHIEGELDLEKQKDWNTHLGRSLVEGYQLLAYRVNRLLPANGSEPIVGDVGITGNLAVSGIVAAGNALILPQTSLVPTIEGSAQWDPTTNSFIVGDGASQAIFRKNDWEKIGPTITINNVAWVIWTDLSAFRRIRVSGLVKPVTSGSLLYGHVSTDNGATWLTGATEYFNHFHYATNATPAAAGPTGYPQYFICSGGTHSTYGAKFETTLDNFNQATSFIGNSIHMTLNAGAVYFTGDVGCVSTSATARNAFRLTFSAGNLNSGYAIMEGIRG